LLVARQKHHTDPWVALGFYAQGRGIILMPLIL
jgi:hypothetical protein